MFGQLIATLKKSPKTIVFTEGTDPRILEASARLLSGNFLKPVLVGNPEEIAAAAEDAGFNIRGAEIADPANYPEMDAMVEQMVELRKGKMTPEQCRDALKKGNYFGTMLVKMGVADCLLGGATYSTADTVRPALQLIKTKPGSNIVSSCFIMVRPAASGENEVLAMADCAINIKPTEDELVEICRETVECAKIFGVDPKVAFLSYSTLGSGKGEDVDKMRNACEKAKAEMPNTPIGGEFQFDAAVSPVVAKTKHISDGVGGHANTFIFPDINAGNIGYKIAQRLGNFDAYGPILLGLNAPINDLSRGCNAQEVYSMAIITAALAYAPEPSDRPGPRQRRGGAAAPWIQSGIQQTRRSLALLFDGHYHRRSGISEIKLHSKEERQAALLFALLSVASVTLQQIETLTLSFPHLSADPQAGRAGTPKKFL